MKNNENFKYLINLNEEIESNLPFLIDFVFNSYENEEKLISLIEVVELYINLDIIDAQCLFGSRRFKVTLYKGILYMSKSNLPELIRIKSPFHADEIMRIHCLCSNPPEEGEIIGYQYFYRKRSYLLTVEETLKKLNIDFTMLNFLIRHNVLRVSIHNLNVHFYSYQVQEVLHILSYSSPDVEFTYYEDFDKIKFLKKEKKVKR